MRLRKFARQFGLDVLKALAVVALSFIVSVGFNKIREQGIPLFAKVPYSIFVPCPDVDEFAESRTWEDFGTGFPAGSIVVDVRTPADFDQGHIPGAVNVPYDDDIMLFGVDDETMARLKKYERVYMYCDGWKDESEDSDRKRDHLPSKWFASYLQEDGIANVHYMDGGLKEFLHRGGELKSGGAD